MTNENTGFSIVIPTYNRADKLKVCINSVKKQTYNNYEIIVVDDGSTDHTKKVIQDFWNTGNELKYIHISNWGGPAHPRNLGIKAAKNEWICFLDSDDTWYPDKLAVCNRFTGQADLIYHDLHMYTGNGKTKKMSSRTLKRNSFRDLLVNGNTIKTSGVCVRKHLLEDVNFFSEDKALIAVEDYDLWLKIAQTESRLLYIRKILGSYWSAGGNITTIGDVQINRIKTVYNTYIPFLDKKDQVLAERMMCYLLAKDYHQMKDYKTAGVLYIKSLMANSFSIKLKSLFFLIKTLFESI